MRRTLNECLPKALRVYATSGLEDEALAMPIVNCSSFSRLFLATQSCFRILDIFGTPW